MERVRTAVLPKFAAEKLRASVSQVAAISGGGMSNKEIAFYISGPDLQKLGEYSARLTTALAKVPGVVDVDTSLVLGKPELAVNLDRKKAAELGVQVHLQPERGAVRGPRPGRAAMANHRRRGESDGGPLDEARRSQHG
jgi:multidrug efflux pump subunit AcrB